MMNRPDPLMAPHQYKTYAIVAPRSTHFRPATCAETDCPHYLQGWQSAIDESSDLGQGQAYYIRKQSGRRFTEARHADGLTVFTFEAGQECFNSSKHVARLDRPELFLVRDGDHRGNPRGTPVRQHVRPADWVEDFAEHQQAIADEHQKG